MHIPSLLPILILAIGAVLFWLWWRSSVRRDKARLPRAAASPPPSALPPRPPPSPRPLEPSPVHEPTADFFVSHASADAEAARQIVGRLEAMGVTCWMAPRNIRGGTPYGEAITHAVSHSTNALLLLMSARANESQSVLAEVELARRFNKRIVPLFLADVEPGKGMLFYISTAQWILYHHDAQQALQAVANARIG